MSYKLPKNKNEIKCKNQFHHPNGWSFISSNYKQNGDVELNCNKNILYPCVSQSLHYFYIEKKKQFVETSKTSKNTNEINVLHEKKSGQIENKLFFPLFSPYFFYHSQTFFDMLEICNTINLSNVFHNYSYINAIHIGPKPFEYYEYLRFIRKNSSDNYFYNTHIDFCENISYNYIYYEMDLTMDIYDIDLLDINNQVFFFKKYIIQFVRLILFILTNQTQNGVCIIKMSHLFYKPIIDIIYLITGLYDHVSIIKPTMSDNISFNKYVVCEGFLQGKKEEYFADLTNWLNMFVLYDLSFSNKNNIDSFFSPLQNSVPLLFMTKINDMNIAFGKKQLDLLEELIFLFKTNKNYKYNSIANQYTQKCILLCNKYNIPY